MTIKINKLEIENVKRVKAVKIEPTPSGLTVIGGKNNQGKTSVLDSIAWALGGNSFKPSEATREGSVIPPNIHVVMSNGLVVERKGKNSDLKVIDPSGQKGGQQLLNEFVEQLALDLPKFMNSNNKEKANTLLQIIGVGEQLYELEQKEKEVYNRRQIEVLQKEYDAAVKDKLPAKEQKRIKANLTRAKARLEKMLKEGKGGLSNTTINYHHRIIHKALTQAVKWQMVARNVADAVEAPEPDDVEIDYVKRHELERFITCIKSSIYYAIYMVAIFTGMRQGEILGLKWQYVDFDAGIINVRQQLQYTAKKGYSYPKPKQKSIRDIPMPLPLNAILRQVRKEQDRLKEIYDDKYEDNDLVFCTPEGRPLNRSLITRNLSSTLEKHGFKHIRFHALRHTFATMARAAGVPMEDIQDLLGHADISTTKNMYTHVEIEPLRKSVDKLTDYMGI